jgi:HEPN domain-containing protein
MTDRPEALEVARRWWRKAGHDLVNARHTMKIGAECPYDTVCFHAQQCAEKSIKALMVMHLVHFARVHDLAKLAAGLPAGTKIGVDDEDLRLLSLYATAGRYPESGEEPGHDEAVKALDIAEKVREAIGRLLPTQATS